METKVRTICGFFVHNTAGVLRFIAGVKIDTAQQLSNITKKLFYHTLNTHFSVTTPTFEEKNGNQAVIVFSNCLIIMKTALII